MKRPVCVVSGGRADYGLLHWILREIRDSRELALQLAVTGMHLERDFGSTVQAIEADGFDIACRVPLPLAGDGLDTTARAVAAGLSGFVDAFRSLHPELVLLLGDRFEALAAAQAAFFLQLPLAHIHGGEVTVGAIDDTIRHVITKLARFHFVSNEDARNRVIQLGEAPDTVFVTGAPGLDSIRRLPLLDRAALAARLGFAPSDDFFLLTWHPPTAQPGTELAQLDALLAALDRFPHQRVVVTKANADAGGRGINEALEAYALARPERVYFTASLGQLAYLSAMKHCRAVVGNSSSGVLEAPLLRVPTVNVGNRQEGRLQASSVISCEATEPAIADAIRRALGPEHHAVTAATTSLYGDGDASARIVAHLRTLTGRGLPPKRFHDL